MDTMADSLGPTKTVVDTLIIGCGNLLRGDDAVGPVLIRHLWDLGLPEGVNCADGGTGGMDVAFQMRGVRHVILVDACVSDSEPGAIFKLPGEAVETLPPLKGINLHAFRWDHALAFAHWLLKAEYPKQISVYLIEAKSLVIGDPLSEPVAAAMRKLAGILLDDLSQRGALPTDEMVLAMAGVAHGD
jgi:hydrogenase maturation protease